MKVLACLLVTIILAAAQAPPHTTHTPIQPVAPPATANPADVKTPDAIIKAVYDVISGPAGQKRDWNRFRSLFWPGARMIATGKRPTGEVAARVLTPDEYIERSEPFLLKEGFFEREIARPQSSQFGNIAQYTSVYESRHTAGDAKPFARGVNYFQLLCSPERCWVLTIYWEPETADNPIPANLLAGSK